MSIGLVLSIIFLILQLVHVIDWEWWQIILPWLIEVGIGLVLFIIWVIFVGIFGSRR